MDTNTVSKQNSPNLLLWFGPAILLLITLFPITLPLVYYLVLKIIVSLSALFIVFLLFTQKPKYYVFWGIAFLIVAFVFNPIIHISVILGERIHFAPDTAVLFMANWFFAFRTKHKLN